MFGLAAAGVDEAAINATRATADLLGKRLDVVCVYDAFAWGQPLPTQTMDFIRAVGATPQITWEPWNPQAGPDQPLYTVSQIAGGRHDVYITNWARQAVVYGRPFYLRFAHEMNGIWYPWSVSARGETPADYAAAFRRVRRIFDDVGAHSVEWVWSPNVIINGDTNSITGSYPGDDFVDVVGVDGYNFGNDAMHRWTSPKDLFGPTLDLLGTIAPAKPVWVNEVGSGDRGGNKAEWITELIEFLSGTDVRGLIWFEADKPGEPDWRLTSTPATIAAAKAALASW